MQEGGPRASGKRAKVSTPSGKSGEPDRLAAFQALAGIGSWEWDLRSGEVRWSDELYKLFGLTPGAEGASLDLAKRHVHPGDRQHYEKTLQASFETHTPFRMEFRLLRKDRTQRTVLALGEFRCDGEHIPVRMLGTMQDITELRSAEEALSRSEKSLLDIASSLAEGLYVLDAEGALTFMNPEAERLLGWTFAELQGRQAHDIFHNRRANGLPLPLAECEVHGVTRTGRRYASQGEVFARKDGSAFPVSILASPIKEGGEIIGAVAAFRDITEMKTLEEELIRAQRLESIGVLAGGIAHDFNNILQAMLGHIELAKMKLDPGDGCLPHVRGLEEAIEQAKDLSFRLLTFARGGEPDRRVGSLSGSLREAAQLALAGSNVTARMAMEDSLPPVDFDEGQLAQVWVHLLRNAREAMPLGGDVAIQARQVTLREGEIPALSTGRYVEVAFTDSGPGISPKHLPHIFDPYFSTKERATQKGMGLGLAISLAVIRKHEGTITVSSTPGAGSTFRVYLPLAAGARETEERAAARSSFSRARRVLFMDDDEILRHLTGEILTHLGYEVATAEHGEAAVTLYREAASSGEPFDAVILDLTVKHGKGGDVAIRELLAIDPKVRAILASGYRDIEIMRNFAAHGFAGAITKPFSAEDLRRLLGSIVAAGG